MDCPVTLRSTRAGTVLRLVSSAQGADQMEKGADRVDLQELRTFRAVSEFGSLSKASGYLHVAQPALSRQIKLLESELRQALFTRDGRGMHLTAAGEYLYERTTGLISGVEHLRDDVRSFEAAPMGRVTLGMVPTVSALSAIDIVSRVLHDYPHITLRLSDGYSGHLADWMSRGEIDIAVMYGDRPSSDYVTETLVEERLCAIGTVGVFNRNPAYAVEHEEPLTLSRLFDYPLILPSTHHPLRSIVERAAETLGRDLQVIVEADSYRVLLGLSAAGHGITVLPRHSLETTPHKADFHVHDLQDSPLQRSIQLVRPRSLHDSVAVQAVADIVRSTVVRSIG